MGIPSISSFIQQRKKMSSHAMEDLLKLFYRRTASTPILFKGYQIAAVDGSELSVPYNPIREKIM